MQYRKKKKKTLLKNSILYQKIVYALYFAGFYTLIWVLIQYNEHIDIISEKALF